MELRVACRCPHCGGELDYAEGCTSIRCPFCQSTLWLPSQGRVLKYHLKVKVDAREAEHRAREFLSGEGERTIAAVGVSRLLHVPFWWYRTALFSWRAVVPQRSGPVPKWLRDSLQKAHLPDISEPKLELTVRRWNRSFPAYRAENFGLYGPGVRLQVLTLHSLDPQQLEGAVLQPDLEADRARDLFQELAEQVLSGESRELFRRTKHLQSRLLLIYFPIWSVECSGPKGRRILFLDGLSGDRLSESSGPPSREQPPSPSVKVPSILAHRCPNCGWDFPVSSEAVFFLCSHCDRCWALSPEGYDPLPFERTEAAPDTGLFLPFWRFETVLDFRGAARTVGEFFGRFGMDYNAFQRKDLDSPLRFFVPAFLTRDPRQASRLALALLRRQPAYAFGATGARHPHLLGSLDVEEAKSLAEILSLDLLKKRLSGDFSVLDALSLHLSSPRLCWIAFRARGTSLEEPLTGFALPSVSVPPAD